MSDIELLLPLRELHDVERIERSGCSFLVGRIPDVDLGQQRERLTGVGGGHDDHVAPAVARSEPLESTGGESVTRWRVVLARTTGAQRLEGVARAVELRDLVERAVEVGRIDLLRLEDRDLEAGREERVVLGELAEVGAGSE